MESINIAARISRTFARTFKHSLLFKNLIHSRSHRVHLLVWSWHSQHTLLMHFSSNMHRMCVTIRFTLIILSFTFMKSSILALVKFTKFTCYFHTFHDTITNQPAHMQHSHNITHHYRLSTSLLSLFTMWIWVGWKVEKPKTKLLF